MNVVLKSLLGVACFWFRAHSGHHSQRAAACARLPALTAALAAAGGADARRAGGGVIAIARSLGGRWWSFLVIFVSILVL